MIHVETAMKANKLAAFNYNCNILAFEYLVSGNKMLEM